MRNSIKRKFEVAPNVITFNGKNDRLFSRVVIDELRPRMSLIVPETHHAIVIKDGEMLQTLSQGKYLFDDMIEVDKDEAYTVEVLYISKTAKMKLLWGTPNKITIADPVLNRSYRVGMSGDFEVQVSDPRKCFLYLVGAEDGLTTDSLQDRLQSMVVSVVEEVLTSFIDQHKISYTNIFHYKKDISSTVMPKLSSSFSSSYGIMVSAFNITNIIFDENDLAVLNSLNKGSAPKEEPTPPTQTSTAQVLYCKECGNKIENGAKFCSPCGARVETKNVCPKCGAECSPGAKFCSQCGQKL